MRPGTTKKGRGLLPTQFKGQITNILRVNLKYAGYLKNIKIFSFVLLQFPPPPPSLTIKAKCLLIVLIIISLLATYFKCILYDFYNYYKNNRYTFNFIR